MAEYIQDKKTGKLAGSIGDGKHGAPKEVPAAPVPLTPAERQAAKNGQPLVRLGNAIGAIEDAARPVVRLAASPRTPSWMLELIERNTQRPRVRDLVWSNPNFRFGDRLTKGGLREHLFVAVAKNPALSRDEIRALARAEAPVTADNIRGFQALREHPNAMGSGREYIDMLLAERVS